LEVEAMVEEMNWCRRHSHLQDRSSGQRLSEQGLKEVEKLEVEELQDKLVLLEQW
jgi:hypothetical protein